ncbi:MAG: PepSY domain-containing protein [Acidovorax sp.]|nr:PepSY domain-containing protein [Acidovorax sp.]
MNRIFHKFSRSAGLQLAAVALIAGMAGVAIAQAPAAAPAVVAAPATPAAAVMPWQTTPALTIRQVYDRLEAAGYRDLREIEWDDHRYEVKARDAQGNWVKLDVDGQSGAVLRSRNKH